MLVVVPQGEDGLKKLINDFNSNTLTEICGELQEDFVTVLLPKFDVQSTSGAEKVFAKEGLASLFTSKADFTEYLNRRNFISVNFNNMSIYASMELQALKTF